MFLGILGLEIGFWVSSLWIFLCDKGYCFHYGSILTGCTETHFTNNFSIKIQIKILISVSSHPNSSIRITTKFCTWHDSYSVVACAAICCDIMTRQWIIYSKMKFPLNLNCEWKITCEIGPWHKSSWKWLCKGLHTKQMSQTWISNCIPHILWDVIMYPCSQSVCNLSNVLGMDRCDMVVISPVPILLSCKSTY